LRRPQASSNPIDGFSVWSPEILSILLPTGIVLLALILDIITSIKYPKVLRKAWIRFSSPFRNFMTLDDLLEPVGPTVKPSELRIRILAALAVVSLVGWLACLAYGVYSRDELYIIRALTFSICWVSDPNSLSESLLIRPSSI